MIYTFRRRLPVKVLGDEWQVGLVTLSAVQGLVLRRSLPRGIVRLTGGNEHGQKPQKEIPTRVSCYP